MRISQEKINAEAKKEVAKASLCLASARWWDQPFVYQKRRKKRKKEFPSDIIRCSAELKNS